MNAKRIKRLVLACLPLVALSVSGGETRAWWHFDETPGTPVGSVSDETGAYSFNVCTNLSSKWNPTATEIAPEPTSVGSGAFLKDTDGALTFLDVDVGGALPIFRPSPDDPSKTCSAVLTLSADQLKTLLPIYEDRTGPEQYSIKSFTYEIVARRETDSTDASFDLIHMLGSADRLLALTVDANGWGTILVDRAPYGDYGWDGVADSKTTKAILPRDGKWHHIAITYDDGGSGNAGRIRIYGDYECVMDVTMVEDTRDSRCAGVVKLRRNLYSDFSTYGTMYVSLLNESASAHANLLRIDEFRISEGALEPSEMIHVGVRNPTEFFFPMNTLTSMGESIYSHPEFSISTYADDATVPPVTVDKADSVQGAPVTPGFSVVDRGIAYPLLHAGRFFDFYNIQFGWFRLAPEVLELMAADPFTLELFVQVRSTAAEPILARGAEWQLGTEDGCLKWTHGAYSKKLARILDGGWHHLAFVYSPVGPSYGFYIDGQSAGTVDDTTPLVTQDAASGLILGKETVAQRDGKPLFSGYFCGFRGTPRALDPSEFLRPVSASGNAGELVHWTLDAPGREGEKINAEFGFLPAVTGETDYRLTGGYITGSYAPISQTGDKYPVVSPDIPCAYTWDAASGRIINPENRTSVEFFGDRSDGANSKKGPALQTSGGNISCSNLTVECFMLVSDDVFFMGGAVGQLLNPWICTAWGLGIQYGGKTYGVHKIVSARSGYDVVKTMSSSEAWGGVCSWHHYAVTFDGTSVAGKTVTTVYRNYDVVAVATNDVRRLASEAYETAPIQIGTDTQLSMWGKVDEVRITEGVLDPAHFMRAFEPRANLTGVWLADGATGDEHFSAETDYLRGNFAAGDLEDSDELPFGQTRLKAPGMNLRIAKSVAFGGAKGGMTIPCAATVGSRDFTFETTFRGTGDLFSKRRFGGVSWGVRVNAAGQAEAYFDTGDVPTSFARLTATPEAGAGLVDDGGWHHVALAMSRSGAAQTATLYVDGVAVAVCDISAMTLDGGDLVVGEGFEGEMIGARFSAGALEPASFLRAGELPGVMLILR